MVCRKSITRFPSRNFFTRIWLQKRGTPGGGPFWPGFPPPREGGVPPPGGSRTPPRGGGSPPGGGWGPPPGGAPPQRGGGGGPPPGGREGGVGGYPPDPKKGVSGPPPGGPILRPKWSQPRVNTDGRTIKIRKVSIWGVHLGENLSIFGAHSFRKRGLFRDLFFGP